MAMPMPIAMPSKNAQATSKTVNTRQPSIAKRSAGSGAAVWFLCTLTSAVVRPSATANTLNSEFVAIPSPGARMLTLVPTTSAACAVGVGRDRPVERVPSRPDHCLAAVIRRPAPACVGPTAPMASPPLLSMALTTATATATVPSQAKAPALVRAFGLAVPGGACAMVAKGFEHLGVGCVVGGVARAAATRACTER